MKENDEEYKIGYKKPPRKNQFKPGESGNPKGRPAKKKKNFVDDILDEMQEEMQVKENGKSKSITKQRALIKKIVAMALQSDSAGILKLAINLMAKTPQIELDDATEDITELDRIILKRFLERNSKDGK